MFFNVSQETTPYSKKFASIAVLALVLVVFLISILLMGEGFKLLGVDTARTIIHYSKGPFLALMIGMLSTAIIQSSSTTTTIIVGIVAAGQLTVAEAVPMIIGANIGTSVTSTIVAFGLVMKRKKYRKAIAAATLHDFFNILVTIILLPLEYFFHILSGPAQWLAALFTTNTGDSPARMFIMPLKPLAIAISNGLGADPIIVIPFAIILLFASLQLFASQLKQIYMKNAHSKLEKILFAKPLSSFGWGLGLTALVQSSSITTSLIVPVAAEGRTQLSRVFPFLLGANIGTTITALLAALTASQAALAIAFAHLLFNLFGALLFGPVPFLRKIPLRMATRLGILVQDRFYLGIVYIAVVFFILPLLLILIAG